VEATAKLIAERLLEELRRRLNVAFSPDTASWGMQGKVPSAGHCVVASVIVQTTFGGDLASAIVEGNSHWFNRIRFGDQMFDVDLTGDQFGLAPILIADANRLYSGAKIRRTNDLSSETLRRAALLARRAGLHRTFSKLYKTINARHGVN